MSAFNVLRASVVCPVCGLTQDTDIQFRYGNTWQHEFRVGARLGWGGNDVGVQGARSVLVEGLGGPCASCGEPVLHCEIRVSGDVVESVQALVQPRDFPPEGYVVVEL